MFIKNLEYENVYKMELPFIHSARLTIRHLKLLGEFVIAGLN